MVGYSSLAKSTKWHVFWAQHQRDRLSVVEWCESVSPFLTDSCMFSLKFDKCDIYFIRRIYK